MTWTSTALAGLMIIVALMPFAIFVQVKNLAHSRSRSRLWLIRDRLVDDLLSGKIAPSRGSATLLHIVEGHIRLVGRHSLIDAMIAAFMIRDNEIPDFTDEILSDEVEPADRAVLAQYLAEFKRAAADSILIGSPSGWAALGLVKVDKALHWRRAKPTRHKQLRAHVESVEVGVIPDLVPARRSRQDAGPILAGPGAQL